jgi:outer membrane protein OmpA-like peptidoglycan-associated protein
MPKLILALLLCISLTACSTKAPLGHGGFAEHNLNDNANHPVGFDSTLYFDLKLSRLHLKALIADGANICFPGTVYTMKIRQNRISRELQGNLIDDAENDLIIQRDQLARLERRLDYVHLQRTCLPNNQNNSQVKNDKLLKQEIRLSAQKLQELHKLLNNNNQFVTDSSDLNPRYIGHLAEVSQQLREHSSIHLQITGHADNTGNEQKNLKLSLQRARQVERYLQIFGINPNNIEVNGEGQNSPLYKGGKAEVLLVNRRVSIILRDNSQADKDSSNEYFHKK